MTEPKLKRLSSLINRSRVKQCALEKASMAKRMSSGEPRFTRVSGSFLDTIEAEVDNLISRKINQLTSSGRTIN